MYDYLWNPRAYDPTRIKALYGSNHLYLAAEFGYKQKPELPGWTQRWNALPPGSQVQNAWWVPCLEFFLDVSGRREHYYQIVANTAGFWYATHNRAWEKEKTGGWWKPDFRFVMTLGETHGVLEASIPFSDLGGEAPHKGDIWGLQVFRTKMGRFGILSACYDLNDAESGTRQYGRLVFE